MSFWISNISIRYVVIGEIKKVEFIELVIFELQ